MRVVCSSANMQSHVANQTAREITILYIFNPYILHTRIVKRMYMNNYMCNVFVSIDTIGLCTYTEC
jgi:hypothetical protein